MHQNTREIQPYDTDDGSNDLFVSSVLRTNEKQVWLPLSTPGGDGTGKSRHALTGIV